MVENVGFKQSSTPLLLIDLNYQWKPLLTNIYLEGLMLL